MLGRLPKTLLIDDVEIPIRTDYRDILRVFEAFNDPELTDSEKWQVCVVIMVEDTSLLDNLSPEKVMNELDRFINFGTIDDGKIQKPLLNWEQDEHLIFSAVNNVARNEIRSLDYVHWWTFIGYFNCIGEGLLSQVIHIRSKKSKNEKLDKHEEKFYRDNKKMIDLQPKKLKEEIQNEIDEEKERIKKIIGMR
jgi:hypothetical protein